CNTCLSSGRLREKNQSRLTQRAESTCRLNALTMESDAAKRWRKRVGWRLQTAPGGRGLSGVFSSGRVRQKLNARVSDLTHEAGCKTHLPRSMSTSVCM